MKTFRKFFGILAAVLSFFAVSCSLFGDEEPSAERNFVEPVLTASVRGSVAVSGAAPGVFRKSSARTALPSLDGVSYSVEASGGGRTYEENVDAENLSFSFGELAVVEGGTEYTITATGTVSGSEVVSGSCTVTLRPGDALFCEVPVNPDMKSGTGSVSLEIDVSETEIKSCAIELDGGSVSSCQVDSGGKILFEKTLDSGCYDAVFSFYSTADSSSADGVLLYEFRESVHVCKSLVTDSWFGSSAYIADGKCEITKTLVDKFALSRIYVSSRKEDSKETGTRAEPYKSVARAMNALLDKDTDYTILVDGELTGAQEIPASVTTANASSITIQGANGLDAGGMPKDSLNGTNEGTTLKISSSVPVTIKNLKITGGNAEKGGGIYNNGTLILKGKNIIYDNKDSNGKQSNVYLPYGKKIKIDGDISGSKIGVSMAFTDTNKPTVAAPVTFTEDYGYGTTNASRPGAVFISDNEYVIGTTDSNEAAFVISGGSFYTPRDYDFTLSCTDSLGNSAACLYTGVAATFTVTPTVTRKETSGTPTPLYYNHADKKLYTNTGLTLTDCDEKVSWTAALYCSGKKVKDITPSDVTGGIGITIPAIAYDDTYTLKVNASYLGETHDAEWILDCSRSISNAAFYIRTMTSSGTVAVEGSPSGDDLWTLNSAIRNVASGVKVTLDLSGTNLTELYDTAYGATEPQSFYNCTNLVGIILPNTLTKIGNSSLRWSGITSIDIPPSVTTIGDAAFLQCKIMSITIPSTVTTFTGTGVFNSTYTLQTAVLNCSANLPNNCFNGCSGLTTVTISSNVKQIGEGCFKGCTKLTTINYGGTKAQWNALTKKTDWNNSVPATVVHCSDGNVAL